MAKPLRVADPRSEFQRDSVLQPKVVPRQRGYLGYRPPNIFNRNAVVALRLSDAATTPLALIYISPPHPYMFPKAGLEPAIQGFIYYGSHC